MSAVGFDPRGVSCDENLGRHVSRLFDVVRVANGQVQDVLSRTQDCLKSLLASQIFRNTLVLENHLMFFDGYPTAIRRPCPLATNIVRQLGGKLDFDECEIPLTVTTSGLFLPWFVCLDKASFGFNKMTCVKPRSDVGDVFCVYNNGENVYVLSFPFQERNYLLFSKEALVRLCNDSLSQIGQDLFGLPVKHFALDEPILGLVEIASDSLFDMLFPGSVNDQNCIDVHGDLCLFEFTQSNNDSGILPLSFLLKSVLYLDNKPSDFIQSLFSFD